MKARAFAVVGSALFVATAVRGEPEKPKPAPAPVVNAARGSLAALPEMPDDEAGAQPARVAAGTRVPGLWVSLPRTATTATEGARGIGGLAAIGTVDAHATPTVIVSSVPLAVSGDADKLRADAPGEIEACVRVSNGGTWVGPGRGATLLELGGRTQIEADDAQLARAVVRSEVSHVRVERLVDGQGGDATLERIDAWVDLRTGGAREVERKSIPLALVRRFGALTVYGARQGDRAVFLVRTPNRQAEKGPSFVLDQGAGRPCGHAIVSVAADRVGLTATESVRGSLTTAVDPEMKESETHGLTTRPFRVLLTASWLGAEPSPAIGASFGWVAAQNPPPQNVEPPPPPRRVKKPKR